ncbi:pleckstrin homology domain-containing family H member 1 [Rhinatrema bivittatum]|uniref:pleckstrin homology domain-containing family H member 1 n=1 Tax=Rhinatrema bivittatum TaxID=194408 RepID=UPI00112D895B|nr:pleckstrin homology domain-containing family H member 1 [Rhinatrema bivittatum]XP_029454708.1 pleckstrin homology domain-containing family H member 1 [Rhinatrema bivittatum]
MEELLLEDSGCMDWQKRCLTLETQLFKFRLQASKIRELLAEKMQELELRVFESEQRAENAEKQVRVMEEKLKLADVKTSESENALYKKYQELTCLIQEKEEVIRKLEAQLEKQMQLRAQEAKVIEEKAAKIKEWVTFKLKELEIENCQLKIYNQKQMEQIQTLEDMLQGMANLSTVESLHNSGLVFPGILLSPRSEQPTQAPKLLSVAENQACQESAEGTHHEKSRVVGDEDVATECITRTVSPQASTRSMADALHSKSAAVVKNGGVAVSLDSAHELHSISLDPPTELTVASMRVIKETLIFKSSSESKSSSSSSSCTNKTSDLGNSSDELSCKFRSQRLDSSSSSGEMNIPNPILAPTFTQKHSSPSVTVPLMSSFQLGFPMRELSLGNSMTLPKVRTPTTPRDSIQLAKKHYSQPQPGRADHFHHIVNIDICSFKPMILPPQAVQVEETDIDDVPEKMETEECENELVTEVALQHLGSGYKGDGNPEGEVIMEPGSKPPTPPLHRFPSWEGRIYAVAKSGMRLSDVTPGSDSPNQVSSFPTYAASSPFTHLIYKNVTVPVYTTLKGRATQISNVPFLDESSGSDDDCSSQASFQASNAGSETKKNSMPGSPRAVKRGVSMSSMSSESDYAIPPDAYSIDSDYSEPEHKLLRTSSYSTDGTCNEPLEKSGYLLKMGSQVKTWKRRWFVLRNGEIMYYKSPSDVIRKPQGQIELNSSCQIVRGEGSQTFQLLTEKKTYYLTADSPNILEEWIRVLQNILKVQAASSVITQSDAKPTVKGWLTKVKHGHSKLVWCALLGKMFYYYRSQEDKCPLGHLKVREAKVEEVDRSCDSDEDYEAGGRGFLSSHYTLVIHPADQSPTYLLIGTKHEKDTWLYHLTVAAGSGNAKVGTHYEQLIGKLLDVEGDPTSPLWKHPTLCYSKDGLQSSLTTLPSDALQTEALKLFKSCQLFINVPIEAASIDYHVSLAQAALQVCLTHTELQNEIYCQLMKQTSCRQPQSPALLQCWQLLALCTALFLPQHHFLWYLKQHLQHHGDARNEIGKYAIYCQRSMERTLQAGDREARPSRMEIVSLLLRHPYHHSLPFSIPVHFMNTTYQVVGFDGSTTVHEFLHMLNQEIGMRKPSHSGFSLFTDDPSGKDLEHCLQGTVKICDVISKWEQALKELHPGKYEGTRIVRLTYKNRMYFRAQMKGETERERLLLAAQVSDEITNGRFPVNKELALEMAALMAQVEHGDLDRPAPSSPGGTFHSKMQHLLQQVLDRFYPKRYKQSFTPEQFRHLADRLSTKWLVLRGCSTPECIRIYLTVARKWPLFGAKLFTAKPFLPSPLEDTPLWIAVNEDGISILDYSTMHLRESYPYPSVMTFGGCQDDFMLVVGQTKDRSSGKPTIEKLIFTMARPKIVELTLLIASYINYYASQLLSLMPPTLNTSSPLSTMTANKLWEIESQNVFPSMPRTTKGPTLL